MKNSIKTMALLFLTFFTFSCNKDEDTPQPVAVMPNYLAFGYFKGNINYPNETAIPVVFVFEDSNRLLMSQFSNTLNESNNLLKGTYTITGNQISGSYTNPNIIPPATYNFSGNYDPKTAKFSGTIATGTITLEKRI